MSAFTREEVDARRAIRSVLAMQGIERSWIESPNPTVVYKAEISGDLAEGHGPYKHILVSATGQSREEALDNLEVVLERIMDREPR